MFTSQVYTAQILFLNGIMDEMPLAQEAIRELHHRQGQSIFNQIMKY